MKRACCGSKKRTAPDGDLHKCSRDICDDDDDDKISCLCPPPPLSAHNLSLRMDSVCGAPASATPPLSMLATLARRVECHPSCSVSLRHHWPCPHYHKPPCSPNDEPAASRGPRVSQSPPPSSSERSNDEAGAMETPPQAPASLSIRLPRQQYRRRLGGTRRALCVTVRWSCGGRGQQQQHRRRREYPPVQVCFADIEDDETRRRRRRQTMTGGSRADQLSIPPRKQTATAMAAAARGGGTSSGASAPLVVMAVGVNSEDEELEDAAMRSDLCSGCLDGTPVCSGRGMGPDIAVPQRCANGTTATTPARASAMGISSSDVTTTCSLDRPSHCSVSAGPPLLYRDPHLCFERLDASVAAAATGGREASRLSSATAQHRRCTEIKASAAPRQHGSSTGACPPAVLLAGMYHLAIPLTMSTLFKQRRQQRCSEVDAASPPPPASSSSSSSSLPLPTRAEATTTAVQREAAGNAPPHHHHARGESLTLRTMLAPCCIDADATAPSAPRARREQQQQRQHYAERNTCSAAAAAAPFCRYQRQRRRPERLAYDDHRQAIGHGRGGDNVDDTAAHAETRNCYSSHHHHRGSQRSDVEERLETSRPPPSVGAPTPVGVGGEVRASYNYSCDDSYYRDEEALEMLSITTTSSCAFGVGLDGLCWTRWASAAGSGAGQSTQPGSGAPPSSACCDDMALKDPEAGWRIAPTPCCHGVKSSSDSREKVGEISSIGSRIMEMAAPRNDDDIYSSASSRKEEEKEEEMVARPRKQTASLAGWLVSKLKRHKRPIKREQPLDAAEKPGKTAGVGRLFTDPQCGSGHDHHRPAATQTACRTTPHHQHQQQHLAYQTEQRIFEQKLQEQKQNRRAVRQWVEQSSKATKPQTAAEAIAAFCRENPTERQLYHHHQQQQQLTRRPYPATPPPPDLLAGQIAGRQEGEDEKRSIAAAAATTKKTGKEKGMAPPPSICESGPRVALPLKRHGASTSGGAAERTGSDKDRAKQRTVELWLASLHRRV